MGIVLLSVMKNNTIHFAKGVSMLAVKINQPNFEYDIHSLIKAFYPETEVKVYVDGEKEYDSDDTYPDIAIVFEEKKITMIIVGATKENPFQVKCVELSNPEDRASVKNDLKMMMYKALRRFTGKTLPWGTLTGIRPTKIPMTKLEEGMTEDEILHYMKETYLVSDEKASLALEIAQRERKLLSCIHYKDGYSLYIGIPFCPTTCLYCSFTSYPICVWKDKVDDYLNAMEKEMQFVAESYKDKVLDSVYIGGGTPTTLESYQLDRLLSMVHSYFSFEQVKEFTVEAGRADSITKEKLEVLKKHQVTRISVNPQTMKEETLQMIGRKATAAQTVGAFKVAREVGFSNINMDIILGLPGETKEDVENTIEKIKELKPDSLTVHSLAIKRASKLSQWIEENGIEALKNTDVTMDIAAAGAKSMDMVPYYLYRQKNMSGNFENVGYATEGNFGIYNILIMEEVQSIIALGAGSISKVVYEGGRIERCDNVKDVGLYIEKIEEMIDRKRALFNREEGKV